MEMEIETAMSTEMDVEVKMEMETDMEMATETEREMEMEMGIETEMAFCSEGSRTPRQADESSQKRRRHRRHHRRQRHRDLPLGLRPRRHPRRDPPLGLRLLIVLALPVPRVGLRAGPVAGGVGIRAIALKVAGARP